MSFFGQLFGQKKKTPQELQKEWKSNARSETRKLDRQIRNIEMAEKKTKLELKTAAKRGDKDVMQMLAKELVQSRKAVNRIHTTKTQLNSVTLALDNMIAQHKIAGSFKASGEIMKEMNALVKVGEVQETMMEMQKEMMKCGMISEQMDEVIDGALEVEDESDEAEDAISAVIDEVMASVKNLGTGTAKLEPAKVADTDVTPLEDRLASLRTVA
eukprot:TRINITY_DN16585_c4_g2_i1.p1 TRINITY_DN16585_c4_g2~~TRINITY_DN16585_c4_g2_i1.p1  ORF type:complete len:214 (+),score=48.83 TRINITY_DN16585_c4_g2_i1:93-734(+)